MAENIVEDWLRSLNLVQYTQSFIDNGYDDLEICKQIGTPDLDAIGVYRDSHRARIVNAVKILKELGGTAVYFTLEGLDTRLYDDDDCVFVEECSSGPSVDPAVSRLDAYEEGKSTLLTYPNLQLKHIVRDKLIEDDINLAGPNYTTPGHFACKASLTALAVKYASELKTHIPDVLEKLEELRKWKVTQETDCLSMKSGSPSHRVHSPTIYCHSPRTVAPPVPSCPPPNSSHIATRCPDFDRIYDARYESSGTPGNYGYYSTMETSDGKKDGHGRKPSSGLSRFLRNMGIRRSGRKYIYKPHTGDPNAFEITMGDDDRMALMLMVKEGKINTETALEVVKRFEDEKRKEMSPKRDGSDYSPSCSSIESSPSRTPQKTDKYGRNLPSKSHSYSDAGARCDVCHCSVSHEYDEANSRFSDNTGHRSECVHQRRVHSISHVEFPHLSRSPEPHLMVSCSPNRSTRQSRNLKSPLSLCSPAHMRIHSPSNSQGHRHSDGHVCIPSQILTEKSVNATSCGQKSSSRTSLLSSESEGSLDCHSHGPIQVDVIASRNGDTSYCRKSNVSPLQRRKANGPPDKLRTFTRSNSYSTGDDGMSSDGDDLDDSNKRLLHGKENCKRDGGCRLKVAKVDVRSRLARSKDVKTHQIPDERGCEKSDTLRSGSSLESGSGGQMSLSPGSGHSVSSSEDTPIYSGPFLGTARVHTDFVPAQDDVDMLTLKRGDHVRIITMDHGGVCQGLLRNRMGRFVFSHVEMIGDDTPLCQRRDKHRRRSSKKSKPRSVEELLQRIGLEHLTSIFLLNGFDQLDTFVDIDEDDLNELNIRDPEYRAKLLTAAELILDNPQLEDSSDLSGIASSDTPSSLSPATIMFSDIAPPPPAPSSRDSGCYDSSENLINRDTAQRDTFEKQTSPAHERNGFQGNKATNGIDAKPNLKCNGHVEPSIKFQRDLSAEDREVSSITNGTYSDESKAISNGSESLNTNSVHSVSNGQVSNSSSFSSLSSDGIQASPKHQGQKVVKATADKIINGEKGSPHSSMSEGSEGAHSDLSDTSLHKKPKPVPPKRTVTATSSYKLGQDDITSSPVDTDDGYDFYTRDASTQSEMKVSSQMTKSFIERNGNVQNSISYNLSDTRFQSPDSKSNLSGVPKGYRQISRTLIPLVTTKLAEERINLAGEPYSDQTGQCGTPPLLVQRYAEELRQDIHGVAMVMEQVRILQLQAQNRTGTLDESLAESCITSCDLRISTIKDLLTSIGLPMYFDPVSQTGCTSVDQLLALKDADLRKYVTSDVRHLKRIFHALDWIRNKLTSPTRKAQVSIIKDKV